MSIGYNNKSIIHIPITGDIANQLELRQKVVGKEQKDDKDLLVLNSNTAWVKVSSGVQTYKTDIELAEDQVSTQQAFDENKEENLFDSTFASQNILFSTLVNSGSNLPGGINFDNSENKLYNITKPTDGWQALPGLTGFSSKLQGSYGTYQYIDLSLQISSLDQLETIETLYFRPGMSVLVEWGNSLYYKGNSNNPEYVAKPKTIEDFFDPIRESEQYIAKGENIPDIVDQVYVKVKRLKEESGYNYDGVFGRITSFNYTFNGKTYDANITILGQGSLIESLKTSLHPGPSSLKEIKAKDTDGNLEDLTERQEVFNENLSQQFRGDLQTFLIFFRDLPSWSSYKQQFLAKIEDEPTTKDWFNYMEENVFSPGTIKTVESIKQQWESAYNLLEKEYNKIGETLDPDNIDEGLKFNFLITALNVTTNVVSDGDESSTQDYVGYIRIKDLLVILNTVFPFFANQADPDSSKVMELYTGNKEGNNITPYTTFDGHYSIDPLRCYIPRQGSVNNFAWHFMTPGENDILNIRVNINFLLGILNTFYKEEKTTFSLYDFLSNIMKEVGTAMGGVNQFGLHLDDTNKKHYIVDRSVVADSKTYDDTFTFDVKGKNSILHNLSISSNISNELATQIAIATSVNQTDVGEDVLALQTWNRGLRDRYYKDPGFDSTAADLHKNEKNLIKSYKILFRFIKNAQLQPFTKKYLVGLKVIEAEVLEYNPFTVKITQDDEINMFSHHRLVMQDLNKWNTRSKRVNPPSTLPVTLSFTIDGISGLSVGSLLKIQKKAVLPKRYDDRVGYVITNISHGLEGNKWVTNIDALSFIIEDLQPLSKDSSKTFVEYLTSKGLIK